MGGRGPHLGLVLTAGAIDGYSVEDRNRITMSNSRGTMLLHPAAAPLEPGATLALGWTLFWHDGWDDFFDQVLRRSRQAVRVDVDRFTCFPGETRSLSFTGELGNSPTLAIGVHTIPLHQGSGRWSVEVPAGAPGETVAKLQYGDGSTTQVVLTIPRFPML